MMTLRTAAPPDHARILDVMPAWWGGRDLRALVPSLFLEHFAGTSLVAEADGELAGFLIGFVSQDRPDEAYVHMIGVDPARRGDGLGRRLHDEFADLVRERGVRRIRCVTSTVNTASVAFHTSIGFVVTGTGVPVEARGLEADADGHVLMCREI
ncbi:GNAT family N-acetyltransferase [Longivirga aurantiaca]|uniref:GNAT family N-acetyltransferase n=1 Tax=Longivirga aurantiaca TaxID=1837743 RepID=A0ABW1SV84_9ACTN